jgi:arylformamidase
MECGIKTLGVDYLSIDGFHAQGAPVHHRLLKDVFVVEGLDLSGVEAGDYLFVALPLKIAGADGAPARAVLIDPRG